MRQRLTAILVLSWLVAPVLLQAAERPKHPEAGADLKLTKGKPYAEFFTPRLNDKACRAELEKRRQTYENEQNLLKTLIAQGKPANEIDAFEQKLATTRTEFLEKVDQCGMCSTQDIEQRKFISVKKTEIWYASDGSCYLDPEKFGKPALDRMIAYLTRVDNYAAYQKNGLRNILEFVAVDPQSGELRPEWKTFEKPFPVFISVLGPTLLGETFNMNYVIENQITESKAGDPATWMLRFQAVPPPQGFQAPSVYVYSASGRKTLTRSFRLNTVLGQWYLDEQGTLRYFTAADFGFAGVAPTYASRIARNVVLETLAHLYELGTGEKP